MSKLLFITQKVDKDDDILGVYHRWVECLSEKVDKLNVVCLYKGRCELPRRVGVFSLGKEKLRKADLRGSKRRFTRIKYVARFWKYIWNLRNDYDVVFVHMNPIYVVLGGFFWKLSDKKVLLWYNHPMGNLMARLGIALADKVFCTSPYSFSAKYKKTVLMPAGIDTDLFKRVDNVERKSNRILYLGRISAIKRIEYLVEAANKLDEAGVDFELMVVGSPVSGSDVAYLEKLKVAAGNLIIKRRAVFLPSVPNHQTPLIYSNSAVFVNLTPTGSFDKSVLEAMICQTLVLVSNRTFENFFSKESQSLCIFEENDALGLSRKIIQLFDLSPLDRKKLTDTLRKSVTNHHSLDSLISKLTTLL